MRRGVGAFVLVAVAALIALATIGASEQRRIAFTIGVAPLQVAVALSPGQEACQESVAVAEAFRLVRVQVGTFGKAGSPIVATVRRGARTLAAGRRGGDYEDVSKPAVRFDREVPAGGRVSVCIRNAGTRPVALYGGTEGAKTRSRLSKDGRPQGTDLTLDLLRDRPRSTVSTVPDIVRRATVFGPGWVGSWTLWLAAVAALLGVPVLVGLALSRAARWEVQEEPEPPSA